MVEHERTGPMDMLTWGFSRIAMWGPAFIVAIIFYEVVLRYVFVRPTLWVNEMSLWAAGGIYVTAGLYSMQQRSHIRIFIIYDMVPRWLQRIFDLLALLCVWIFALAVLWGGYGEAVAKFWRWETFGTAFDPPIPATNKPLIIITLLILALQATSNLVRDWPMAAPARKAFDIISAALVVALALFGLPVVFASAESGIAVPMAWRVGIGILMVVIIALVAYGLLRDFNRTPAPPVHHTHDPSDDLDIEPSEVLTGDPPRPDKDR